MRRTTIPEHSFWQGASLCKAAAGGGGDDESQLAGARSVHLTHGNLLLASTWE